MLPSIIEPGTEWTSPDNRGVCGFCGQKEGGYAIRGVDGAWTAACWPCAKPKNAAVPQRKRATVGTVYTDVAAEEPEENKKKNPGMAPCKSRPKVL